MLPRPQSARFNADALLRTDTAGRYAVYTAARSTGILTVNEIRALENYAPIADGDDIAMPLNSSAPKMKDNEASPTAPKADALGAVL
jgi:phage portal protein BeeE